MKNNATRSANHSTPALQKKLRNLSHSSYPRRTRDRLSQVSQNTVSTGLTTTDTMAGPTTRARATWVADRVTALPEVWAVVALHLGLVGAWRLMLVCKAARVGVRDFLNTLPGLIVCGGSPTAGTFVDGVWRLDLATLRWEVMPSLGVARAFHACCVVRRSLVVIGGYISSDEDVEFVGSVEMFAEGGVAVTNQPPLSCGGIVQTAAIAVDESESTVGQVMLLGGRDEDEEVTSTVHLVDLATGMCTPQPHLLHAREKFAAVRLPDRSIVCAGGVDDTTGVLSSVEVFEPPAQGALDTAWTWREVPAMIVARQGCRGCMLSDGRFAVLGGNNNDATLSSCEALLVGDDEHWEIFPPMHVARTQFACAAMAGCIVVAGGYGGRDPLGLPNHLRSAEVFDEVFDRWLRLPCDLPHNAGMNAMGSALR